MAARPNANAPWWADIGDEAVTIRDKDGSSVWIAPRAEDVNEADRQAALAQLTAMAPELFISVAALVRCMTLSNVELENSESVSGEEWDDALEDAQALLDLLTESGVFMEEAA